MNKLDFANEFVEELPTFAARALESQRTQDVSAFVEEIPDSTSSRALQYMMPHLAAQCLHALPRVSSARYLAPLPPHSIASILRYLPKKVRQEIIGYLPNGVAFRVRLLLNFPRTVVGSWIDTSAIALPEECTIAEALRRIQNEAGDAPSEIYVIDEEQRLTGKIWVGSLLSVLGDKPLKQVLIPIDEVLTATAPLQSAINHAGWENADVLPVIDRSNLFIGTVRYRELRRAIEGLLADQSPSASHGAMPGLAETWFVGLANMLDAVLAQNTEDVSDP